MMDTKQESSAEKTKQDMAKVYGISLADIEEVILPNGKEYFKFYNPEERTIKMIENRTDSGNLSEQFKAIQTTLMASQSENEKQNARAVFDYQLKYQNIELKLISIRELNGNRMAYKYLFDNLDPKKKRAVRVLIENMEYLNLEYINLENAIGIDKNNRVITATYNDLTGKCKLMSAEVRNYEDNKVSVDGDSYTISISDEEFDAVIDQIDVASDTPIITEAQELEGQYQSSTTSAKPTIRGREVNLHFAIQAYQYPEIIDRSELSTMDKMIYRGLVKAIKRKKTKMINQTKAKQYVNTPKHNQAAFIDSILLSLLLGFFSGLLLTLIYLAIKAGV